MSHFAQVIDGIVQQVIVADQDFINTLENPAQWIQTSYNTRGNVHYAPNSNVPDGGTPLRANYAGGGFTYDAINDVFYAPQPFPSWILNTQTWLWESPVPRPSDSATVPYFWNEESLSWVKAT